MLAGEQSWEADNQSALQRPVLDPHEECLQASQAPSLAQRHSFVVFEECRTQLPHSKLQQATMQRQGPATTACMNALRQTARLRHNRNLDSPSSLHSAPLEFDIVSVRTVLSTAAGVVWPLAPALSVLCFHLAPLFVQHITLVRLVLAAVS